MSWPSQYQANIYIQTIGWRVKLIPDNILSNPVKGLYATMIFFSILYILMMLYWKIIKIHFPSIQSTVTINICLLMFIIFYAIIARYFSLWIRSLRALIILPISKGKILFYIISSCLICSFLYFISAILGNTILNDEGGNLSGFVVLSTILLFAGVLFSSIINLRFDPRTVFGLVILIIVGYSRILLNGYPNISSRSAILFGCFFVPVWSILGILSLRFLLYKSSHPFRSEGNVQSPMV